MKTEIYYLEELDQLVTVRKAFGNFEYFVIERGYDPDLDIWQTVNTPEFYGFEYVGEL